MECSPLSHLVPLEHIPVPQASRVSSGNAPGQAENKEGFSFSCQRRRWRVGIFLCAAELWESSFLMSPQSRNIPASPRKSSRGSQVFPAQENSQGMETYFPPTDNIEIPHFSRILGKLFQSLHSHQHPRAAFLTKHILEETDSAKTDPRLTEQFSLFFL